MRDPLPEYGLVAILDVEQVISLLYESSCYYMHVDSKRIVAICNKDVRIPRSHLDGIVEFRIFDSPLSSVDFLAQIETLRILDIHHTRVQNLESLRNMNLEYLDISVTAINNLEPIATMKNLKVLKLSSLNITHIQPLSQLTKLRELHIDFCYSLRSIDPLRNLYELEVLNMAHTNISDISPLLELAEKGNLKIVDLTDTFVPREQIADLASKGVKVIARTEDFAPKL